MARCCANPRAGSPPSGQFHCAVGHSNILFPCRDASSPGPFPRKDAQIGGPRSIWNLIPAIRGPRLSHQQAARWSKSQSQPPTNYTCLFFISLTITVGVVTCCLSRRWTAGAFSQPWWKSSCAVPSPAKYPPPRNAINSIGFLVLLILAGFFLHQGF